MVVISELLFLFQELSGLKCDGLLSSGQFLPTECVSGLVELAGSPSTSPALTSAIISLLAQLGEFCHSRVGSGLIPALFLHRCVLFSSLRER